jgi:hypothetical protein
LRRAIISERLSGSRAKINPSRTSTWVLSASPPVSLLARRTGSPPALDVLNSHLLSRFSPGITSAAGPADVSLQQFHGDISLVGIVPLRSQTPLT